MTNTLKLIFRKEEILSIKKFLDSVSLLDHTLFTKGILYTKDHVDLNYIINIVQQITIYTSKQLFARCSSNINNKLTILILDNKKT